jgi:hypothetical protein
VIGAERPRYEEGLTLEALKNLDPLEMGCKPEENFHVAVMGFQPEFDPERALWRCDIEMDAGRFYSPFVRLGLARYQPDSLIGDSDCKLSAVVQAEFMQLTPDRFATMQYESDYRVNLRISGFSYRSRRSEEAGPSIPGPSVVKVAIEERCKDLHGSLRWQRIPVSENADKTLYDPLVSNNSGGETVWEFPLTLPRSRKVSRYRVVIYESEEIAQDKDNDAINYEKGYRIVYADVLGV